MVSILSLFDSQIFRFQCNYEVYLQMLTLPFPTFQRFCKKLCIHVKWYMVVSVPLKLYIILVVSVEPESSDQLLHNSISEKKIFQP